MATVAGRNYFDPETLDKIARLDLRARLVVEGFITGLHKSPYHGFAVEFATHREYCPGDEIKHIDWKVWSKTDRLYIKEYEEETNLRCTIVLDTSKSMAYDGKDAAGYGRTGMSKFDYAATAAACLAHLLQHQQDAVGLVTFDNKIVHNLPASTHPSHRKLLVHTLQQTVPSEASDVGDVFRDLAQQISRRGMVVILSDLFVDLPTLRESLRQLRHRKHDVIVLQIMHKHELTFPFEDNTLFRGMEVLRELHTEPRALRKAYLEVVDRFLAEVRRVCASNGIDHVLVSTKDSLSVVLSSYLAARQKTRRSSGAKRK
ncbi:MAG: DUF58 domain-containing protein [Pirellulales bacterium]